MSLAADILRRAGVPAKPTAAQDPRDAARAREQAARDATAKRVRMRIQTQRPARKRGQKGAQGLPHCYKYANKYLARVKVGGELFEVGYYAEEKRANVAARLFKYWCKTFPASVVPVINETPEYPIAHFVPNPDLPDRSS